MLVPFHIRTIVRESSYEVVKQLANVSLNPPFEEKIFAFDDTWQNVKEGSQAPEFELNDFYDADKKWTKSSLRGKVILIDFGQHGADRASKRFELRQICKENAHPDLVLLLSSFDTDEERYREFLKENMWSGIKR